MNWFVEGSASNRDEFIKNAYQSKVNRFWLKKGETREIIFTSDDKFGLYEHTLPTPDGRFEPYTCSGEDCEFCASGMARAYAEYSSILDLTPYTSKKDNKEHKFSKRALGVGKEIAALLEIRRKECGGSLVGKKFKVTRIGEKSKTVGNDWVHVPLPKPIDLSKLAAEYKPYDFKDALRPLPVERQRALLKYSSNSGVAQNGVVSRDSLSGVSGSTGLEGIEGEAHQEDHSFDQENDIPF